MMNTFRKAMTLLSKTPLAVMVAMTMIVSALSFTACDIKKAKDADKNDELALAVILLAAAGGVIPNPPADDTTYFQVMIDNRVSSIHTVHFTVTANKMLLTSADIYNITWLTGGGASYDDWTQPVFQIVDSTSGVSGGANFDNTRDFTLSQLPLDTSGKYRILKIPFRDLTDATYSLAGSSHLTITLDKKADMAIGSRVADPQGIGQPLPSPYPLETRLALLEVRTDGILLN
ncbi:MAG: hypothetical protein KA369_23110 [Spirochaetes bacterium]|nr:hypothetical protein [Spirochaetota bacterium]